MVAAPLVFPTSMAVVGIGIIVVFVIGIIFIVGRVGS